MKERRVSSPRETLVLGTSSLRKPLVFSSLHFNTFYNKYNMDLTYLPEQCPTFFEFLDSPPGRSRLNFLITVNSYSKKYCIYSQVLYFIQVI